MSGVITFENITFLVALFGVGFGIYHFFRNPDISADKRLCLLESLYKSERERSDILLETEKNHLHEIESTQKNMIDEIKNLTIQVSNLGVIIDERIPRK